MSAIVPQRRYSIFLSVLLHNRFWRGSFISALIRHNPLDFIYLIFTVSALQASHAVPRNSPADRGQTIPVSYGDTKAID